MKSHHQLINKYVHMSLENIGELYHCEQAEQYGAKLDNDSIITDKIKDMSQRCRGKTLTLMLCGRNSIYKHKQLNYETYLTLTLTRPQTYLTTEENWATDRSSGNRNLLLSIAGSNFSPLYRSTITCKTTNQLGMSKRRH